MKYVICTLVTVACLLATGCGSWKPFASNESGEEVTLLSDKDLTGWSAYLDDPAVKMEDVWSVEDGMLICKGEPLGYIYTDNKYTSYRLTLDWRWAPGTEPGNSGVLLRVNDEPRAIPRCIEAQLKSGSAGDLYGFHGMKIDGDADRKSMQENHELLGDMVGLKKMAAAEKEPGEWNRYEIVADGPKVTLKINGVLVNEAHDCDVVAGPIGLQSEGGEIHFRNIRLVPIQ